MPYNKLILIFIPLFLSAFTHLWNASEFPSFHIDEGVYIRRALHTLDGLGPHDPDSRFDHPQSSTSAYDHPYFGQIFLAAIFKIIDFPQNVLSANSFSIEKLFDTPRLIMGSIAIVDTFLIYKIGERRFNPAVGLISALLFAVMPSSWFTRRVVLDSLMLPFILTSILLALESRTYPRSINTFSFLSGIALGLAIFTKIPAFTLIPLISYLIYQRNKGALPSSRTKFKTILLFMFPVIAIPLIWPGYAFFSGELDQWFDGVFWQATERQSEDRTVFDILNSFLKSDPVLLILGTIGIGYLTIRRDFMGLIWLLPYFLLLYFVGWVSHFHLIIIIPILCISIAKMIYDVPSIIRIKRRDTLITSTITATIVLFGMVSTIVLISTNLSYIQLETASYIANESIPVYKSVDDDGNLSVKSFISNATGDEITVISGPLYSWIYKYVFDNKNTFSHIRDTQPIKTEKIILVIDPVYKRAISGTAENQTQSMRLSSVYNNTFIAALFEKLPANYTKKDYPFTGIDSSDSGLTTTEIRKNY